MAKGFILGQEPKIPEIDAYTKQETLTNDTVSMFGLSYPQIPDSIFSFIGKYNLYWWKRRTNTVVEGVQYNKIRLSDMGFFKNSSTVSYSSSVSSEDGIMVLSGNVSTISTSTSVSTLNNTLRGKYFKGNVAQDATGSNNGIYCFTSGSPIKNNLYDFGFNFGWDYNTMYTVNIEYSKTGSVGEWEYIYSNSESTYPKSGIKDGYEYIFLGRPFNNMRQGVNIEIGSWIGYGKKGQSNPNSIAVSFPPKIIALFREDGNIINGTLDSQHKTWVAINYIPAMSTSYVRESFCSSVDYSSSNIYYGYGKRSEDGKTITWYHESNSYLQWNSLGSKYYWVAIG